MKATIYLFKLSLILFLLSPTLLFGQSKYTLLKGASTNSYFDNDTLFHLPVPVIRIGGEVVKPGIANYEGLPLRSVIVKEAVTADNGTIAFVGAYRYEGYALTDILNPFRLKKANGDVFPPEIDIYIQVANDKGDTVVISWGELYYANRPEGIMIATKVMRIVPEKSLDQWPLTKTSKLIIPNDLRTDRNIDSPTSITILTPKKELEIVKGKFPMVADTLNINAGKYGDFSLISLHPYCNKIESHTIFYGKGRGIHSTEPVVGNSMYCILRDLIPINKETLQKGLLMFAGDDGYNAIYTFSEIANRNDQEHTMLLFFNQPKGKGKFRIIPSCDFFSDRAVSGLKNIWFTTSQF